MSGQDRHPALADCPGTNRTASEYEFGNVLLLFVLAVVTVGAMAGTDGAAMRRPIAKIRVVDILAKLLFMPPIILAAVVGCRVAQIGRGEDAHDACAAAETERAGRSTQPAQRSN